LGRDATFNYGHTLGGVGMAYAFSDGELVLGAGLSGSTAELRLDSIVDEEVVAQEGVSLAEASLLGGVGVLFAPKEQRYRLGCTLRWPVELNQANASRLARVDHVETLELGNWQTPRAILVGGSFAMGFSYLFGPKPANATPTYGERPPPAGDADRRYVLVTADLEITGSVDDDAIGVLSYLADQPLSSGRGTAVSVRAGAESEVLPNRLRVRGGAYFEPSRFESAVGRPHLVAGADVRITVFWDWSLSAVADVAPGYRNWSLGMGFWH